MRRHPYHPLDDQLGEYQTLKGVCFFEAERVGRREATAALYQTLKGVCFFEALSSRVRFVRPRFIPDAERRLLL